MPDDPQSRLGANAPAERPFDAALLKLARISVAAGGTNLRQALHEVADTVAGALGVNRVSIWRFIEDGRAIRCDYLYQPGQHVASEGTILHARDFPAYFHALQQRRVVPVADVAGDPHTEEFREPYFRPLGISSMLDAPIYRAGAVAGIICHEHVGPVRQWSPQDCEFAASVAEVVARLYEEAARMEAEQSLDAFQSRAQSFERISEIGRLAAGMAHDFGNVLNAITLNAHNIMLAAEGDPAITRLAEQLIAAVERGEYLARELRSLRTDEPNKPRVVDLAQLLEQIRSMLVMVAGPSVSLGVDVATPVGPVLIDADQLERVLVNLVANARDACQMGGTITISLREAARDGERAGGAATYVVLDVRDNGTGMDAETLQRMFEPLFTTKGDRGTGLGLAIAHRIVTLAGGFIEAESAPGRGTTVRVLLPRIASTDRSASS